LWQGKFFRESKKNRDFERRFLEVVERVVRQGGLSELEVVVGEFVESCLKAVESGRFSVLRENAVLVRRGVERIIEVSSQTILETGEEALRVIIRGFCRVGEEVLRFKSISALDVFTKCLLDAWPVEINGFLASLFLDLMVVALELEFVVGAIELWRVAVGLIVGEVEKERCERFLGDWRKSLFRVEQVLKYKYSGSKLREELKPEIEKLFRRLSGEELRVASRKII